jgi:hypothetical protein
VTFSDQFSSNHLRSFKNREIVISRFLENAKYLKLSFSKKMLMTATSPLISTNLHVISSPFFPFHWLSLSFSLSFVCGCLAFGLRLSVLSVLPSPLSRVWLPFGDQTFSEYLHYSVQGLFFSPSEVSGLFRPLPPSLGFCYTHQFASTSSLRLPTKQTLYTRMHPPA